LRSLRLALTTSGLVFCGVCQAGQETPKGSEPRSSVLLNDKDELAYIATRNLTCAFGGLREVARGAVLGQRLYPCHLLTVGAALVRLVAVIAGER